MTAANTQSRIADDRDGDTLRARHNEMVRRLAALALPQALSVYDSRAECGHLLRDQVTYLRSVVDAIAPTFERCADDAADHGGARAESFDLVHAATEDFVAPISVAAQELIGG